VATTTVRARTETSLFEFQAHGFAGFLFEFAAAELRHLNRKRNLHAKFQRGAALASPPTLGDAAAGFPGCTERPNNLQRPPTD
jgi:hypothetical protein